MRRSTLQSRAALPLGLLCGLGGGCLWDNPGFSSGGEADAASGSGTGATTGAPTTGAPTTGGGSTGGATATSAGTTGGDMSSGTGDTTTAGTTDCWGMTQEAWAIEPVALKDAAARSPTLSHDGLHLYYHGPHDGERGVFRVSRASPDDAFPPAGELFHFESDLTAFDYPAVRKGEEELFFTQGSPGDVYVTRKVAGSWQVATIAGGFQLFGGEAESHPNLVADGSLLLFQRQDGPAIGALAKTWNFYQAERDPMLAVFPDLAPTQVTPIGSFFTPVCPALSPDGLHLFFGASDSPPQMVLAELNDGRVGVWYGRRAATTDPAWTDIARSAVLRTPGVATCPTAVTLDGCQMTLIEFKLEDQGMPPTYNIKLARRG